MIDLTFSKKLYRYLSIKASAKNIFDEDYLVTQDRKVVVDGQETTETHTIERYPLGRSFSFGMSFGL